MRYKTLIIDSGLSPDCYEIIPPTGPRTALVVASPHSGTDYPAALLNASPLDRWALRRSEDSFVDALFAGAPAMGAPLLRALFPRAYVDANREPYELDPGMFEGILPSFVNTASARAAAGLGTIPRVVADGDAIYREKLTFAEVKSRIDQFYRPYHAALEGLVAESVGRFGRCVLVDAHSMPSSVAINQTRKHAIDIVLGDCMGKSCDPAVIRTAERVLKQQGYRVALNVPYAGGYTTATYGKPHLGRHALQIEINRSRYMDEARFVKKTGFARIRDDMAALLAELTALIPELAEEA